VVAARELDRAREMFLRVFGPDYGAELCSQLGEGYFNEILMCRIAPHVWESGEVPLPSKVLCAIVLLAAANQDCSYFIRAAIHHGISRRQVEEVLLLAGLEAGFPAAGVARRRIDAACEAHQAMLQRLGRPRVEW
jgi:alkylhydroperoxidase/carboxymuconolactone decarboxylase family protein YurZ